MQAIVKFVSSVAMIAATFVSGGAEAASGRVAVPARPDASSTCYQVAQRLYGPYAMVFCLARSGRGAYRVTGGGFNCNAGLNWNIAGSRLNIALKFSTCGPRLAWSADSMSCTAIGSARDASPRLVVPNQAPRLGNLNCTYVPQLQAFKPLRIRARQM